jgi:uncharacterized membrane protein
MVSLSFNPIGSWPVVVVAALAVTALTLWAYALRLRGTSGSWRWFALGLRLAALLLCVIAALRPSVVFKEKQKQPSTLIFLSDASRSMTFADEVRGQKRWEVARKAVDDARAVSKSFDENLKVKFYRFDSALRDDNEKDTAEPNGRQTALGTAMLEAVRRESGTRVANVFVLSDGANNFGVAPLVVAQQFKSQQIPVVTVGFGSESAGSKSRDIAMRDLVTSSTVFVKNQMIVKGTLLARGFENQTLEVEMLVDGKDEPVATQRVRVAEGAEQIPITGLKYVPQTPGEKKVTLRVKPKDGELVATNNETSTFVKVLKGGLNVLFVQGPRSIWEQKFLMRSIATSPDIQADLKFIHAPSQRGEGALTDDDFAAGRYDVYVLSDLPADFLTPTQHALLARSVDKGAGLIMLGGRSSFGEGGWGNTEISKVLPVAVRAGDGQIEPEGGVPFTPNPKGLESYLMQIAPTAVDSARIWKALPPLTGINHLGKPKDNATIFATTPGGREPIMVGSEAGSGRALAFAGETWIWARSSDEGRVAHRKFWRQIIFWLAHKEDQGQNDVKVSLESRRISIGQKLEIGVKARDDKGVPLTGLKFDAVVEGESNDAPKFSEKIELFDTGDEWHSTFYATQTPPGDYKVTVVAKRNGQEVGRDSAKFLVYQDDVELESPAAERALLRQVAEASGGESLPHEQLPKFLRSLQGKVFTETYTQIERKVWDNWPFFLLFTALLTMEWWLRKRHGWV